MKLKILILNLTIILFIPNSHPGGIYSTLFGSSNNNNTNNNNNNNNNISDQDEIDSDDENENKKEFTPEEINQREEIALEKLEKEIISMQKQFFKENEEGKITDKELEKKLMNLFAQVFLFLPPEKLKELFPFITMTRVEKKLFETENKK